MFCNLNISDKMAPSTWRLSQWIMKCRKPLYIRNMYTSEPIKLKNQRKRVPLIGLFTCNKQIKLHLVEVSYLYVIHVQSCLLFSSVKNSFGENKNWLLRIIFMEQIICNLTTNSIENIVNNSMNFWSCAELTRDLLSPFLTFNEIPPSETQKEFYIVSFSILIALSVVLNFSIISYIVAARCNAESRNRRPKTDDFIISLAVSDFLISFLVIPFNIYRIYTSYEWTIISDITLNTWSCHLSGYIQSVSVLSSMFTLTALSVDR